MIKRCAFLILLFLYGCKAESTYVGHKVRTGSNGVLFLDLENRSDEELCFFYSDLNYLRVYDDNNKNVTISAAIEDSFGIHSHVESGGRLTFSLGTISKGKGEFGNGGHLELDLPVYKCHDFESQNQQELFVREPFSSEHMSLVMPHDNLKFEVVKVVHSW